MTFSLEWFEPLESPFVTLGFGESIVEGQLSMVGESISMSVDDTTYTSICEETVRYRQRGSVADCTEFAVGDTVRAIVRGQEILAVQNASVVRSQMHYGWVEDISADSFILRKTNDETVNVFYDELTRFQDDALPPNILYGYSLAEESPISISAIENTNTSIFFVTDLGTFISPVSDELVDQKRAEEATLQVDALIKEATAFSDVSAGDIEALPIGFAKSKGIVSGYPDGSFGPGKTVNRAEFSAMFMGAFFTGITQPQEPCFPDVPADSWFAPFVCEAKDRGIITGYPDGTFKPEETINFAESMAILAGILSLPVAASEPDDPWYRPFLLAAENAGLAPTDFAPPDAPLTRGSVTQLIFAALAPNILQETYSLFDL